MAYPTCRLSLGWASLMGPHWIYDLLASGIPNLCLRTSILEGCYLEGCDHGNVLGSTARTRATSCQPDGNTLKTEKTKTKLPWAFSLAGWNSYFQNCLLLCSTWTRNSHYNLLDTYLPSWFVQKLIDLDCPWRYNNKLLTTFLVVLGHGSLKRSPFLYGR
jgi:hypothetical protein